MKIIQKGSSQRKAAKYRRTLSANEAAEIKDMDARRRSKKLLASYKTGAIK
jgi:hypothetical protein